MNSFSESFSGAFQVSKGIFGEKCTINASEFDCIIQMFTESDSVTSRPGRSSNADGTVTMSRLDWITASGRKGVRITLPHGTYRVLNDPLGRYETDTVELQIGPLS